MQQRAEISQWREAQARFDATKAQTEAEHRKVTDRNNTLLKKAAEEAQRQAPRKFAGKKIEAYVSDGVERGALVVSEVGLDRLLLIPEAEVPSFIEWAVRVYMGGDWDAFLKTVNQVTARRVKEIATMPTDEVPVPDQRMQIRT